MFTYCASLIIPKEVTFLAFTQVCLTLSTLDKIFSRRYFEIFFLIFPGKQDLIFHANCLQCLQHEISNPVIFFFFFFFVKNKTNINVSTGELAQREVMAKSFFKPYAKTCFIKVQICLVGFIFFIFSFFHRTTLFGKSNQINIICYLRKYMARFRGGEGVGGTYYKKGRCALMPGVRNPCPFSDVNKTSFQTKVRQIYTPLLTNNIGSFAKS